jgi:hypothetical protein
MSAHPIDRPADLDVVRESYDRVADNYAHMVVTTGVGDIRKHPWLKASIDAFADTVRGLGPVLDVGCGPGTVTAYLAECRRLHRRVQAASRRAARLQGGMRERAVARGLRPQPAPVTASPSHTQQSASSTRRAGPQVESREHGAV